MDPRLPIQPSLDNYGGHDAKKQKRRDEFNHLAIKIALHANERLAGNPSSSQTIYFSSIAIEMKLDVQYVWKALSLGDHNGRFVRITDCGREALNALKDDRRQP